MCEHRCIISLSLCFESIHTQSRGNTFKLNKGPIKLISSISVGVASLGSHSGILMIMCIICLLDTNASNPAMTPRHCESLLARPSDLERES